MRNNELYFRLTGDRLTETEIADLSRDMAVRLSRESGITATVSESAGPAGSKGDAVTIGAIILSLVGSRGVISSLMNVLKAYVERKPTLASEVQRGDQKISIRGESLQPQQLEKTGQMLKGLIDDGRE
jgi:hypothetical protein